MDKNHQEAHCDHTYDPGSPVHLCRGPSRHVSLSADFCIISRLIPNLGMDKRVLGRAMDNTNLDWTGTLRQFLLAGNEMNKVQD